MSGTTSLKLNNKLLESIKYDDKGLVPGIAQHIESGEILMLAYMNEESLDRTIESGNATFWSRSRQKLWMKGETSGHVLQVKKILVDCDQDALILLVIPKGPACHTGERSCFYRELVNIR